MRDGISTMEFLPATRRGLQILMDRYDLTDAASLYFISDWAQFVFLLREEPDDPNLFPAGKWATIQKIESLITEWAREQIQQHKHCC